jgi:hypothetical protein
LENSYMKKSLVALAAMAVVGAASAQVTITGLMSMSYQSSMTGTYGLSLSDSSIFLGDTEDLGGGTKVVTSLGFDAGGHTTTGPGVSGLRSENTSMSLIGHFGTVKLASYESDGPFASIEALSGASLDVGMFDSNAANNAKRFRNGVFYTAPIMGGFAPGIAYVTLAGQYSSTPGSATDTCGSAVCDSKTKVVPYVTYTNGGLTAYAEYDAFNANYNATATTPNADDPVTQPVITVKYDFGAAVVGAGWTKPSNDGAVYILAASVPVGALTFGVATESYTPGGSSAKAAGTSTFTEASVGYSLSKRTSLKASFGVTNDAGVAYANGGNTVGTSSATPSLNTNYGLTQGLTQNGEYRVGLYHSF